MASMEKDRPVEKSEFMTAYDDAGFKSDEEKNRDYAGAVAKTDPAEIRLVRKLDSRILVR